MADAEPQRINTRFSGREGQRAGLSDTVVFDHNLVGQVLAEALVRFYDAEGEFLDWRRSLFLLDQSSGVATVIADDTDPLLGAANPLVLDFQHGVLNEAGQVAFVSGLFSDEALFAYDPAGGLTRVVGVGDSFFGGTVAGFEILDGSAGVSGLNNLGQLAFRYDLDNGESGVAVFTVPEPGVGVLLTLGLTALSGRPKRRTALSLRRAHG
ncbi:MAG: hypothetical protein AAFX76_12840 [Planctomycetota bacterium]